MAAAHAGCGQACPGMAMSHLVYHSSSWQRHWMEAPSEARLSHIKLVQELMEAMKTSEIAGKQARVAGQRDAGEDAGAVNGRRDPGCSTSDVVGLTPIVHMLGEYAQQGSCQASPKRHL